MRTLTRSELAHRTALELSVLHAIFNQALVAAAPMSAEWRTIINSVDAIQAERNSRLEQPFSRAF
jgi:hypothetical protein